MRAVLLAGGYGTRLSEETAVRPKPMVEIGGRPILWHIMKMYGAAGITEFVVCCGYKGDVIRDYFAAYALHNADATFDLKSGDVELHHRGGEPWRVTLVDTGERTMTGGRVRRVRDHLDDETFLLAYGDGVADLDVTELIAFHQRMGRTATVTAVHPPARFGAVELDAAGTGVTAFSERPDALARRDWISAGFFVLEPAIFDHLVSDQTVWEREPLEGLAREGSLAAYAHQGFWQPMDTLRDRRRLEELWQSGAAPWKCW